MNSLFEISESKSVPGCMERGCKTLAPAPIVLLEVERETGYPLEIELCLEHARALRDGLSRIIEKLQ